MRDVDAEAVDAALEPEAHDLVERLAHLVVPPVEIRLLGQEVVQVVLTALLVERPRRAPEDRLPVVRRRPVGLRVAPYVPVALRGIAEPWMPVARVVGDEVEQHAQVPTPRLDDQIFEVPHRPELGMHAVVVGDVVAPVAIRRREGRIQPHRVDAEPLEVVELRDQSS